jgi:hypothetical protein
MEAKAIPVICVHKELDAKWPKEITLAPGQTLRISALGIEALGWSIPMRQLYLALQDAARGATYVKDGDR